MAQLMPLPLTVSCFSKIQIGFSFLAPAHSGSPGQRAVKRECVYIRSYTLLRVPLGDFDFSYVATSCGVPGAVSCLAYVLFLLIALNAFVMFD